MQWFAFGGYNEKTFVGFGSRTDAALFQEYLTDRQRMPVRFREISAEIGKRAARQVDVVDLNDRLVDIAIADEVDLGDYDFEKEEEIDVT